MCRHLVAIAARQKLGSGLDEGTSLGRSRTATSPSAYAAARRGCISAAGACIPAAASRCPAGYFYPPTIVADIADGTRLVDEEQFGPQCCR